MTQRHAAITNALVNKIASGVYPVGSLLPSEEDLAESLGVSRGTLRVALDKLQHLGLISRRKRAGTKVEARTPPVSIYEPTISSVDELIQYSTNSTRTIHRIGSIVMDRAMAAHLGCAPGTAWMQIDASRSDPGISGPPVAWWCVFVNDADGARIRGKLRKDQRLISDLIHEATGRVLDEVRQTVRAVGVPEHLADALQVAPDAHALEFVRRYYDQAGQLFQIAVSVHPSDRSSYTTVLKRASAKNP